MYNIQYFETHERQLIFSRIQIVNKNQLRFELN